MLSYSSRLTWPHGDFTKRASFSSLALIRSPACSVASRLTSIFTVLSTIGRSTSIGMSKARSRKAWRQDDRLRPLLVAGLSQSRRLTPILAAYDARTLVSSSSARCVQTLAPYSEESGWPLATTDRLSEEDATAKKVLRLVDELLHSGEGAVLCTHRPVLPAVFDAIGVEDPRLEPGALLVVHHRKGKVVATERW